MDSGVRQYDDPLKHRSTSCRCASRIHFEVAAAALLHFHCPAHILSPKGPSMTTRATYLAISAVCVFALCIAPSNAATTTDYPSRPIRFIVPSAPGGTPDIIARVVGAELSKQMGQQVVVDNRAGANGAIGLHMLARSAPDGYTIAYGPVSAVAVNPSVTKLQYDTKDLQPVVQLVFGMHILTVNPSLPIKSVRDLIDYAKAN